MRDLQQLSLYINRMVLDVRLKPVHISLSVALCHAWIKSEFCQTYNVSRRQLMQASRIQSKAAYHKALRDLQIFGYVEYRPSYHRVKASAVTLFANQKTYKQSQTKCEILAVRTVLSQRLLLTKIRKSLLDLLCGWRRCWRGRNLQRRNRITVHHPRQFIAVLLKLYASPGGLESILAGEVISPQLQLIA